MERLNHHLNILGWPKSSLGFFCTIYGEAQTKFLANPILPMEDPGYTALAPRRPMEAVNSPFQNKMANGEREKFAKENAGPPPTSHTPPLTPDFQGEQVWEVAVKR